MDNDFQAAIDLISTEKVPAGKLIIHRYALAEINEAFAIAANKQAGKRVQKIFGAWLVEIWSNWTLLNRLKIGEFHPVIESKP